MILETLLSIIILATSLPLAYLSSKLLKDEKELYMRYLPFAVPGFFILALILFFINLEIALTITYLFLASLFLKWFTN